MRAGSSLLTRILSAHSGVDLSYDSVNFFRFCYNKYDPVTLPANYIKLFADMSYRLKHRFDIHLDIDKCVESFLQDGPSYGSAYMAIQKTLFPNSKILLGDKEALAWTYIPAFLDMFEDSKSVILLRDPRDVVNSFRKISIAPGCDYLISLFNCLDCYKHSVRFQYTYPDRVRSVRFEQLKLNPSSELSSLFDFLGLTFSDDLLDMSTYTDHSGNTWDPSAHLTDPTERDPLAPVGRWRNQIPDEDLFLCEWIASDQIKHLGLPFSGNHVSQETFDAAISKINSSPLLRDAFKRWVQTGEGVQKFPLDPTKPSNWDPDWNNNPAAFS